MDWNAALQRSHSTAELCLVLLEEAKEKEGKFEHEAEQIYMKLLEILPLSKHG
jgi:hypothetical protein